MNVQVATADELQRAIQKTWKMGAGEVAWEPAELVDVMHHLKKELHHNEAMNICADEVKCMALYLPLA